VPELPQETQALEWTDVGTFSMTAGVSEPIIVSVPASPRFIGLRASATGDGYGDLCYRFEAVTWVSSSESLVAGPQAQAASAVCTECAHKVMAGRGYTVAVFPNDGGPLAGDDDLRFQVQVRHCTLGLRLSDGPPSIHIQVASEPQAAADSEATLQIGLYRDPASARAMPSQAGLEPLRNLFRDAGIELSFVMNELPESAGNVLDYDAGGAGLDGAWALAPPTSTDEVPVLLVGCLRREGGPTSGTTYPFGQVPRIPGGGAVGPQSNAVFISTADCDDPTQPKHAREAAMVSTLAHELGHYLGLYHVADPENLMHTGAPDTLQGKRFSSKQVDVLRRHPSVRLSGR
jgi:hypothetical protein